MAIDWLAADPLDAHLLQSLLTTRSLGRRLEVHRTLPSTNDRARELARAGATPGLVVIAEEQTRGRGRMGRAWISRPGIGLWMTVLVGGPEHVPSGLLTLGAGVAVKRAIARACGVEAGLKWPNDLEVGEAKLCGILGEVVRESTIALGIGINVHESPPAGAIGRAAIALDQAAGRPVARNPLAALVLAELERMLADLGGGLEAQVLAAWREGCNHLGSPVQVTTGVNAAGAREGGAEGAGVTTGIALDIDSTGALLLRRDDGTVVPMIAGSLTALHSPRQASASSSGAGGAHES